MGIFLINSICSLILLETSSTRKHSILTLFPPLKGCNKNSFPWKALIPSRSLFPGLNSTFSTARTVMKDFWLPVSNSSLTFLSDFAFTFSKAVCKPTLVPEQMFPTQEVALGSKGFALVAACTTLDLGWLFLVALSQMETWWFPYRLCNKFGPTTTCMNLMTSVEHKKHFANSLKWPYVLPLTYLSDSFQVSDLLKSTHISSHCSLSTVCSLS